MSELVRYINYLTASDWVILVGFLLGAGFAVLGFVGLPFGESASRNERIFWSIVMFLVTTSISFGLKTIATVSAQIDRISAPPETTEFIKAYITHILVPHSALEAWIRAALAQMTDDYNNGFVDMPVSKAPYQIGEQYQYAHEYVLATNVGGLTTYFNNRSNLYKNRNKETFERGVPVIRYFFYDLSKTILIRQRDRSKPNFEEFTDAARQVSRESKTPFAETINATSYYDHPIPDLLFTDAPFFALTQIDDEWTAVSARATESASGEIKGTFDNLIDILQSNTASNCSVLYTSENKSINDKQTCYFLEMSNKELSSTPLIRNLGMDASSPNYDLAKCVESEVIWRVASDIDKTVGVDGDRFPRCH